jgi:hypothetical protein
MSQYYLGNLLAFFAFRFRLSLPLFFKLLLIYLFCKMRGMGGLEGAEPAERMLCFNVGGFL